MSKEPRVESILWSTANVVKLTVFVVGLIGGYYAVIHNYDQRNAELLNEIHRLREDLNVYIAEAKGKNDLQDLQITQLNINNVETRRELADMQISREGIKPKPINIESE